MDRHSVEWRGFVPAITTTFTEEGELDWDGWHELIETLVAQELHGIAVAGTTGEWFSVTDDERAEMFRIAVDAVAGRVTVLGGCTALTPRNVIAHAEAALDAGLDGILLTPPPYVVPSDREIEAWYRSVSDAVPIPICVYNWPRGTNVDMTAELARRLVEIEHVVAIKNSTGDLRRFLDVFFAVRDSTRYFGVPLSDLGIFMLQNGADGQIGGGGILTRDEAGFFEAVWSDDLAAARQCAESAAGLWQDWLNADYSPKFGTPQAIVKTALNLLGLPAGQVRPPLLPLTEAEIDRVRGTLNRLGLIPALR